jgi:hypothetical protein
MPCYKNEEQNHNRTDNRSFENLAHFKYLGMTITNKTDLGGNEDVIELG